MANKERIDYLLLDIRELEKQVAAIRDAEVYPLSFFSQSFELAHKILTDLHTLEADQLEVLSHQMEEHRRRMHNIPPPEVTLQAEIIEEDEAPETGNAEPEITQTIIVYNLKKEPKTEMKAEPTPELPPVEKPVERPAPEKADTVVILDDPEFPPEKGKEKNSIIQQPTVSLNEILEKKNLSDFRKAFSLNDRFRFRRELFGGDEERMNKAIADLNDLNSYEDSITYLHNKLNWNIEDPAVAGFIKLLEKRFL